ncbi:sarcosine oxidase subunit gamma [Nisaea nitritireducens]|uniref:sarcosine oxidase subunit gamma n=1 Tax=Nisaea nitritireducens TaxID=568392 RepID=UPI0018679F4D|nr:sarcosine oxidase subunit gamma family protein [Nisaea nitritireducens]
MADTVILARRSALAGVLQPGDHGANRFDGPGIHLTERTPFSVVQVEARAEAIPSLIGALESDTSTAPSLTPNQSAGIGQPRILGTGTGKWLVVEPETRDLAGHLRSVLPDSVAVTDLSHARTILRLSGRDARTLLAKGCSIDMHPSEFLIDTSRMTGLFHAAALIDCRSAEPVFDIYVHRSYAVHLFESLLDGALEHGCRVS